MRAVLQLFLVLSLSVWSATPASAGQPGDRILVSQDFTEALARSLTAGTAVEVIRVIPDNYSPDSHTTYLKKHFKTFTPVAQGATAVLTMSSSWPEDPLYPYARRANIRIVPIRIDSPMDNSRAGVPLLMLPENSRRQLRTIWYSPGNAARMIDIAASDLAQLFAGDADTINRNKDILKERLFKLRTDYEMAFSGLDAFEVVALTPDFSYLTDEFGIHVQKYFLKPEHRWQEEDVTELSETLRAFDIGCVLAKWAPQKEIAEQIETAGAKIVVPEQFHFSAGDKPTEQLVNFYTINLNLLLQGLNTK